MFPHFRDADRVNAILATLYWLYLNCARIFMSSRRTFHLEMYVFDLRVKVSISELQVSGDF